jgi:hypothetical protein
MIYILAGEKQKRKFNKYWNTILAGEDILFLNI